MDLHSKLGFSGFANVSEFTVSPALNPNLWLLRELFAAGGQVAAIIDAWESNCLLSNSDFFWLICFCGSGRRCNF